MTITATVLYPKSDDFKFDLDYYLKTHMPLVFKAWSPYGLKGYTITKQMANPASGEEPKYGMCALLTWDKAEDMKKAIEEEGKEVFGDIPNFTNVSPVLLAGSVVAAHENNGLVV